MVRRLAGLGLALTMLLAATPVFAQQAYNDEGIGFGLLGGITMPKFDEEEGFPDISGKNGWLVGIWFGGNRNGTLGFMGEFSYLQKKGNNDETDQELKQYYLEIPALIRINLGQTNTRNGFLVYPLIGPVVDIQLKGEIDGVDVKDQFNGFDIGIMGGVGVEIARIGVEFRGNWGLRSLNSDDGGQTFGGLEDSKNFMWQLIGKIRLN